MKQRKRAIIVGITAASVIGIAGAAQAATIYAKTTDMSTLGTDSADTIYGSWASDNIWGNGGNDVIYGNDQGDTLRGNTGRDKIYGQGGGDQIHSSGYDYGAYGGAGGDWFIFDSSKTYRGYIDCGGGTDTVHVHNGGLIPTTVGCESVVRK